MNPSRKIVLVLSSIAAFGLSSFAATGTASAACNPYRVTFTTKRPPQNVNPLPLYYNIMSTCPGKEVACGGTLTVPVTAATSIQQKCSQLVAAIQGNPACGSPAGAGFTVTDQCVASNSFVVADPACTDTTAAGGVLIGVANATALLQPNATGGTVFGDYELDLITPDCSGATGDSHAQILGGTATGVPINPGSPNASVVAVVDLTPLGGAMVQGGTQTVMGDTAGAVTGRVLSSLNVALAGAGMGVTCTLNASHNRVFSCSSPHPGGPAIATAVQVDDTGLVRGIVTGSAPAVQSVAANVDNPNAPTFDHIDKLVLLPVPATRPWTLLALVVLLAGVGIGLARARSRSLHR
jgi:hypothetical protein